jgi:hypothetical protein
LFLINPQNGEQSVTGLKIFWISPGMNFRTKFSTSKNLLSMRLKIIDENDLLTHFLRSVM